jgi:RNA polymerase sigma factor (sigma-70 family)
VNKLPENTDPETTVLIAQFKDSDVQVARKAFNHLYGHLSSWLTGLSYCVIVSCKSEDYSEEPADLSQATLIRAFRKRHQFRGATIEEFQGWLRTIVNNVHYADLRKMKKRVPTVPIGEHGNDPVTSDDVTTYPFEVADLAEAIKALLAEFPPWKQRAFVLYVNDMTITEIARRLNMHRGTISGWISEIRIAIQKGLSLPANRVISVWGKREDRRHEGDSRNL